MTNLRWFFFVLVLVSFAFGSFFFYVSNQTTFDEGTYNYTFYNATAGALQLNVSSTNGTYTSKVFDGIINNTWIGINWTADLIRGGFPNKLSDNVVLFHLDETSGTIVDYSSGGNNGTYNGVLYNQSGKINRSLGFDNTNDKITVVYKSNFDFSTQEFTVEAWIYPYSGDRWGVIDKTRDGATNSQYLIYSDVDNKIRFSLKNTTGQYFSTANSVVSLNTWTHVVGRWMGSGKEMSLWINGVKQTDNKTVGGSLNAGTGSLLVGHLGNSVYPFDGNIDEVAIWNRSLTDAEIYDHYKTSPYWNVSVRSCDDSNCSGDVWNNIYNSMPQNLTVPTNRYFQFGVNLSISSYLNYSYNISVYNVTIEYSEVPEVGLSNPKVIPDPIILGNPANWSVDCTNATSATLYINKSGNVTNYALTNYSATNWSMLMTQGGLNGTVWYYWYVCSLGGASNTSSILSTTILLPNISLTISGKIDLQTNELTLILYNITSVNGYNFDARWIYLNLDNFTYISARNLSYPFIDSFNTSSSYFWFVISPNQTGTYNTSYIVGDNWGNVLSSNTITIRTNAYSYITWLTICLIILAALFAYLFTTSQSAIWSRMWLFMCGLIIVSSLFISMTFAESESSSITGVIRSIFISCLMVCMVGFYYLIVEIFTMLIKFMTEIVNGKKH